MSNYYNLLGIPFDASFSQIYESYLRSRARYDELACDGTNLTNDQKTQLSILEDAYFVLANADTRFAYDTQRLGLARTIEQSAVLHNSTT